MSPEQFAYYTFFHHRRQEPLGAPFAHILDKHIDELLVRDDQGHHIPEDCPFSAGDGYCPCQAPNIQPDPTMTTKMSSELGRVMEECIATILDSWDAEQQATAYLYLINKLGMTLERARVIRVKAGLSD